MSEWTPTPWRVRDDNDDTFSVVAKDSYGEDCAIGRGGLIEANAARIVQCVNGFDALVEALKEACDLLRENKQGNPARSAAHNARLVIEAALANASPKKTVGNLLPPSTSNPEGK